MERPRKKRGISLSHDKESKSPKNILTPAQMTQIMRKNAMLRIQLGGTKTSPRKHMQPQQQIKYQSAPKPKVQYINSASYYEQSLSSRPVGQIYDSNQSKFNAEIEQENNLFGNRKSDARVLFDGSQVYQVTTPRAILRNKPPPIITRQFEGQNVNYNEQTDKHKFGSKQFREIREIPISYMNERRRQLQIQRNVVNIKEKIVRKLQSPENKQSPKRGSPNRKQENGNKQEKIAAAAINYDRGGIGRSAFAFNENGINFNLKDMEKRLLEIIKICDKRI